MITAIAMKWHLRCWRNCVHIVHLVWEICKEVSALWEVHYITNNSRKVDTKFIAELGPKITTDRKHIARFLGLPEQTIEVIEENFQREGRNETACKLLEASLKTFYAEEDFYSKLVNAIHCVHEHTGRLEDALWYIQ